MEFRASGAAAPPGAAPILTLLDRLRQAVEAGAPAAEGSLTLAQLKASTRALLVAADTMREGLSSEGDRTDNHRLTLSNVLYQRAQLQRAVADCRAFPTPQLDSITFADEGDEGERPSVGDGSARDEEAEAAAHAKFKAHLAHEAAGRKALLARVEAAREQLALLRAGNAALEASLAAVPTALTAAMGGLTGVLPAASDAAPIPAALPAPLRALAAHIAGTGAAAALEARRAGGSTTSATAASGNSAFCQVVTAAPGSAPLALAREGTAARVRVSTALCTTYAAILQPPPAAGGLSARHGPAGSPPASAAASTVGSKRRRASVAEPAERHEAADGTTVIPLSLAAAPHPLQLKVALDTTRGSGAPQLFTVAFQPLAGPNGRLTITADAASTAAQLAESAGGGVGVAVEGVLTDSPDASDSAGADAREGGCGEVNDAMSPPPAGARARLEGGAPAAAAADSAAVVGLAPAWLQAVATAGTLAEQRAACVEALKRLWDVVQGA
jgi:hypothetical protein